MIKALLGSLASVLFRVGNKTSDISRRIKSLEECIGYAGGKLKMKSYTPSEREELKIKWAHEEWYEDQWHDIYRSEPIKPDNSKLPKEYRK